MRSINSDLAAAAQSGRVSFLDDGKLCQAAPLHVTHPAFRFISPLPDEAAPAGYVLVETVVMSAMELVAHRELWGPGWTRNVSGPYAVAQRKIG